MVCNIIIMGVFNFEVFVFMKFYYFCWILILKYFVFFNVVYYVNCNRFLYLYLWKGFVDCFCLLRLLLGDIWVEEGVVEVVEVGNDKNEGKFRLLL